MPDFKSIADFRRDNGIHKACKRFIAHCRELDLFRYTAVAIDSSKLKAANSRDKNVTPHKLEQRSGPGKSGRLISDISASMGDANRQIRSRSNEKTSP